MFSYRMWCQTWHRQHPLDRTYPTLTKRGVSSRRRPWASSLCTSRPTCICTWILIFTLIAIFALIPVSVSLSPVVITDWGPGYSCHLNSLAPWSTIYTWIGIFTLITIFTLICKPLHVRHVPRNSNAHMIMMRNTQNTNEGKCEAVHKTGGAMYYLEEGWCCQ